MKKKKPTATLSKYESDYVLKEKYGPEPLPDESIASAMNWYNYMVTDKQKKVWFLETLDKKDPSILSLKKLPDYEFSTVGTFARIISRGGHKQDERIVSSFERKVDELKNKQSKEIEVVKPKPKIDYSIPHIELLDKEIDKFLENDCKTSFDFATYIKDSPLSAPVKKQIESYYTPQYNEIQETLQGKDEQLNEAYKHLGKQRLNRYKNILEDIVTMSRIAPPRKKSVRKKVPPADKQVKDLKYMIEDPTTELKSVHPERIVGSKILWVWNPKKKRLGLYKSRNGIMVTGTSLKNYDEMDAFERTVRKPEFFKTFKGTQTQKEKLWKQLAGKEYKMTNRISKDVVLLGA